MPRTPRQSMGGGSYPVGWAPSTRTSEVGYYLNSNIPIVDNITDLMREERTKYDFSVGDYEKDGKHYITLQNYKNIPTSVLKEYDKRARMLPAANAKVDAAYKKYQDAVRTHVFFDPVVQQAREAAQKAIAERDKIFKTGK